ncbi:phospholipid carrier-dependent glycosyltransferase [Sphingomonas cannabina]|uniref:phospholipid carrier-dependent glycosyltransferase n=1 Tax=Sphingomonas cannabina TaxID=2899123 RepID=UPI001F28BCBD|nr:phospholipid carrier-dependent glycosyltransferase [Sphingomonas cannabina]UIJ44580.1 phospholipid carrier-dependent glycosyltransferase [Sphingomonas cannabina]
MTARRPWLVALLIGLAAQILFSVNVARPHKLMFDEVHYVPAARAILTLDRPMNTEHPLLGKEIIAAGIAVFGDDSLGWRAFSTLAGTATVLGVFAILVLLFGSVRTASYGALFTALNFTVFIQARIAMLDGFMAAFVVLGIASLLWAMRAPPDKVLRRWLLGAALLGLATATKWAAAPYVAFAMVAFLWVRSIRPRAWPGLGRTRAILSLGIVSVAVYFVTFLPALFYAHDALTPAGIIPFQWRMYESQTQILSPHPYQSSWWSWPLMFRPIWYLYEPVDGAVRGVLLIGNPVIMWGGLVAVLLLAWRWWKGSAEAGAVALLWAASLAIWAIIPKSLGFYYYYHLSGIFICIALAAACHMYGRGSRSWWTAATAVAAVAAFVHFYPIIAAGALPDDQGFNRWMWLDSWR